MRVCFVNCRRSRFAVSTAKSNKTATMENESLYLLVTNYVTCTNVWIFLFFFAEFGASYCIFQCSNI